MRTAVAALLLAGLVSPGMGAPAETCIQQKDCSSFASNIVSDISGIACYLDDPAPPTCVVEVCLTTGPSSEFPYCVKSGAGLSHTCSNSDGDMCPLSTTTPYFDFSDSVEDNNPNYIEYETGGDQVVTLCQYGTPGQQLVFSVKDGNAANLHPAGCGSFSDPDLPYSCGTALSGEFCGGGNGQANKECLWTYMVPEIACDDIGGGNDPLIMGLKGQVFKFEGRHEAWYSVLATDQVQWNWKLSKFDTCPDNENIFVTAIALTFFDDDGAVEHTIEVAVPNVDDFFPGCPAGNEACLGDGSLKVTVNGVESTSPDAFYLDGASETIGTVLVHNTHAPCSRKWFDFEVTPGRTAPRRRLMDDEVIDYIFSGKKHMIDPEECESWLAERRLHGDLFEQDGAWTTIHVTHPLLDMQMEYRQDGERCNSHLLDTWFTRISEELYTADMEGILGETKTAVYDADGAVVKGDRALLLKGKLDSDYEVDGPFGTHFKARGM